MVDESEEELEVDINQEASYLPQDDEPVEWGDDDADDGAAPYGVLEVLLRRDLQGRFKIMVKQSEGGAIVSQIGEIDAEDALKAAQEPEGEDEDYEAP